MKVNGPIITLAVGGVVAVGLLIANLATSNDTTATVATSSSVAAPAAASASASPVAATDSAAAAASSSGVAGAPAPDRAAKLGDATYAGKVDGGGPLSISVKGKTAVAYLCDGKHEAWLWGTAEGNVLTLKNKNGDTLNATRGGGLAVGEIKAAGTQGTFKLPLVKKPSGLYRSTAKIRGAKVVSGWVVLPDGKQVGMTSTNDDEAGAVPAPMLDVTTGKATIQGTEVIAAPADPETDQG